MRNIFFLFFSPQSYTSERNHFFLKSKVPKSQFVFQCLLYPACAGHGAVSGHGEDASTIQSSSLHFLLTLLDLRAPFEEGCELSEPSCPFCPLSPRLPFSSSGMSPCGRLEKSGRSLTLTLQPWAQHSLIFLNVWHFSSKSESCRALPVATRFLWPLPSQALRRGEEQQHCSSVATLPSSAPSSGSILSGEQSGHTLPSPWLPLSQLLHSLEVCLVLEIPLLL